MGKRRSTKKRAKSVTRTHPACSMQLINTMFYVNYELLKSSFLRKSPNMVFKVKMKILQLFLVILTVFGRAEEGGGAERFLLLGPREQLV